MKIFCWGKKKHISETISNVNLYAESKIDPTTNEGCPPHEDTVCTNAKYCDVIIDACQNENVEDLCLRGENNGKIVLF